MPLEPLSKRALRSGCCTKAAEFVAGRSMVGLTGQRCSPKKEGRTMLMRFLIIAGWFVAWWMVFNIAIAAVFAMRALVGHRG